MSARWKQLRQKWNVELTVEQTDSVWSTLRPFTFGPVAPVCGRSWTLNRFFRKFRRFFRWFLRCFFRWFLRCFFRRLWARAAGSSEGCRGVLQMLLCWGFRFCVADGSFCFLFIVTWVLFCDPPRVCQRFTFYYTLWWKLFKTLIYLLGTYWTRTWFWLTLCFISHVFSLLCLYTPSVVMTTYSYSSSSSLSGENIRLLLRWRFCLHTGGTTTRSSGGSQLFGKCNPNSVESSSRRFLVPDKMDACLCWCHLMFLMWRDADKLIWGTLMCTNTKLSLNTWNVTHL